MSIHVRFGLAFGVLAIGTFVASCDSDSKKADKQAAIDAGTDGATNDAGASITAIEFCTTHANLVCQWAEACTSLSTCEDWGGYTRPARECQDALASIDAGKLGFDPAAADECLAAVEALSCTDGPPHRPQEVTSLCARAFVGKVALGGECMSSDFARSFDECEEGYCVHPTGDNGRECLGSCEPFLGKGGDCSVSGTRCESSLVCFEDMCRVPRKEGASCASGTCEEGLFCVGEPSTCRVPKYPGDACTDNADCEGTAVCHDSKCTDDAPVGADCKDESSCGDGLYCRFANDVGKCAQPVAMGADCDPNLDQCEDGYTCGNEQPYKCLKSFGAVGESCGPLGCEEGLFCNSTTCEAKRAENANCVTRSWCQDGLFCGSGDGKCHAPGGVGTQCQVFDEESCTMGTHCSRDTYTCTAPRAEDETCNPAFELESCGTDLYCACLSEGCPGYNSNPNNDDVCKPQLADGAACERESQCKGGYCTDQKCASEPSASGNCSRG